MVAGVELVDFHAAGERVPLGMGVADHGVAGMPAVPDVDGVAGTVDLDAVDAFDGAEAARRSADAGVGNAHRVLTFAD